MPTGPTRRAQRHPPQTTPEQLSTKIDELLRNQKETNELLTLLVRACVRTVQVPAGQVPPGNAVRVDDDAPPSDDALQ